jgi:hypothetical protein
MPRLSKRRMVAKPMFYETVSASPVGSGDVAFDSTFKPGDPGQNCTLRISLRVFYHQINPPEATAAIMWGVCTSLGIPISAGDVTGWYPDWDKKNHIIKKWTMPEWLNFTNAVKNGASRWDSKFWLVPPDEFPFFDLGDQRGSKTRPNVKCAFTLEVRPFADGAHRTIDVVNLAVREFFRSDGSTYSADDVTQGMKSFSSHDQTGAAVPTQQDTVTHETGHALGLLHIGQLLNTPDCGMAISIAQNPYIIVPKTFSKNFLGGIGANVCYGEGSSADAINNIMGTGMQFSSEDAQPWLDRLPEHLDLSDQNSFNFTVYRHKWKVLTADAPPRAVR